MESNKKVLALCGMAGSGKTTATNLILKLTDYSIKKLRFGVTEYALEKFGKTTEKIERSLRSELRDQYGMGYMAEMALPRIKEHLNNNRNVVIENMYSWSEYKVLLSEFGDDFFTLSIHASPKTRYQRLVERSKQDPERKSYVNPETTKRRDYSEIEEIEKAGPIAMADFHVVNEGTRIQLEQNLNNVLSELEINIE